MQQQQHLKEQLIGTKKCDATICFSSISQVSESITRTMQQQLSEDLHFATNTQADQDPADLFCRKKNSLLHHNQQI